MSIDAPSMKTIAEETGVSIMTVSLALRNNTRISVATRRRIHEAATRLGYRTNPMVASLMTQIRSSRPIVYQANLGVLVDNLQVWEKRGIFRTARQGILERAQNLGFLVDVFPIEKKSELKRIESVLDARNIQGVILAPLRKAGALPHLHCAKWSAVALGNSILSPRFHRVTHHQFHGINLVLQNLARLGYRRIGLAIEEDVDEKVDRCWTSCFTGYQLRIPPKDRVPVLLSPLKPAAISAWLRKHRPQVVLGHDGLYSCLRQLGLRVPQDVAFAWLSVPSEGGSFPSGLNQNWKLVGAAAVDSVVAQLYRNERGIPETPKTIMLEGTWVAGQSAPGVKHRVSRVSKSLRSPPESQQDCKSLVRARLRKKGE